MASESTKKSEGIKKSTTKATTSKKATTKTTAEKQKVTKKTTSKSSEQKKTAPEKKTTKKAPKKTVSATKSTASTTVKKTATTSTKKSQGATPEKKDSKKNIGEKKVVVKEPVKKIKEKEEKRSVEQPVPLKTERKITKQEPQEHFGIYLFLLSTILICLHVMSRFNFTINDIRVDYSVVLFSSVYFVSNIITKKFDFKKSIFAIAVSAVAMLLFVYFSRYLNTKVVDYFVIYGNTFAYIISQLLNLIIYYYLLVNTELKSRWVYLTYLFSLAAYYFISILFSTRIIITDSFWPTFFCSFILSGIIAIMYAFYDSLIRRGHE